MRRIEYTINHSPFSISALREANKRMEAEALVAIDTIARERDAARAEVARLLALATGPKINDEVE